MSSAALPFPRAEARRANGGIMQIGGNQVLAPSVEGFDKAAPRSTPRARPLA
jgi:hypothetical protein